MAGVFVTELKKSFYNEIAVTARIEGVKIRVPEVFFKVGRQH